MGIVWEGHGDILRSKAQTLVVPVNVEGAMGKGLAKQFREAYPGLYIAYRAACQNGWFERHGMFVYDHSPKRKILCFPTKRKWRQPSRMEWIETGLELIAHKHLEWGIHKLAVPALGCGEGKLKWPLVYERIYSWLDPLEIEVGLFLPKEETNK